MVATPLLRDYLGRDLHVIVPTSDVADYLGRGVGAGGVGAGDETDYLGRLLLGPA